MYRNRLEEIKTLHDKANKNFRETDVVTEILHELFHEEHTDWLIEQAEKVERYETVLKEIIEYSKYEGNQWYENAKEVLKD